MKRIKLKQLLKTKTLQQTQKIYKTRQGSPFKEEDAQIIGEFIDSTSDKSTKGILEAVRNNPDCAMYKYIEWDDTKAADEYRLQQIRNIVEHIIIEVRQIGNHLPIRAFYSIREIGDSEPKYVSMETAFDNVSYRQQIIERAKSELRNWAERYSQYEELSSLIDFIRENA